MWVIVKLLFKVNIKLIQTVCLFGYSETCFIFVSIFSVLPSTVRENEGRQAAGFLGHLLRNKSYLFLCNRCCNGDFSCMASSFPHSSSSETLSGKLKTDDCIQVALSLADWLILFLTSEMEELEPNQKYVVFGIVIGC